MLNIKETYRDYANNLIKKGISPSIIVSSDIIKLLTEDEDRMDYNFKTDNIISGPYGDLIRINKEQGIIEIYNSITVEKYSDYKEYYYSLKLFDLETGDLLSDGELGYYSSTLEAIDLYGEEEYEYLDNLEKNDFSDVHRLISKDKDEYNINRLELSNELARVKLKDLREKLFNVAKIYCKGCDHIVRGIGKIVSNIDDAYKKHSEIKEFRSLELDEETIQIINRKLYLDGLKEESEAYSRISIFPITDIIKEYKEYNAPVTDKIANKYIKISRKIAEVLDPFSYYRCKIRNHQKSMEEIEEMFEKHRVLLLKRRDELDMTNSWDSYE